MRNLSNHHQLPANPIFVSFERSDGDSSTWPRNTEKIVDHEGHVNYMNPVSIEMGMGIKWRVQVGEALANALKWPKEGPYVLQDWPKGYAMFDHNKGLQAAPRHDIYLFGPKKVPKFRSVPEFIPHAIWLFEDPKMDSANCKCKYCAKKAQREITANMGQSGILPPSPTASPGPSARRPITRKPDPKTSNLRNPAYHASVQKVKPPKYIRPSRHLVPGHMQAESASDLRAVHSQSQMKLKRWLREDEVVWCALKTPIPGPQGGRDSIRFWPGIVDDIRVKPETFPRPDSAPIPGSSNRPYDYENPPWAVKQYTQYKVKLLASKCELVIPDDQVLPYLAHQPRAELIAALTDVPPASLKYDDEHTAVFNPCPDMNSETPSSPPSFVEAAGPFALAIEIASKAAHYWGLTDEWTFDYMMLSSANRQTTTSASASRSLADVLSAASSSNAAEYTANPAPSYGTSIATNNPNTRTEDVAAKTLGPPPHIGETVQQTRYQGMWWGCERIWTHDFVRLKLARRVIAPNGAPHILPAAGPGKALAKQCAERGKDPKAAGAASRATFMRLDSLFLVNVTTPNGDKKKEVRAGGMLYELVDEDWDGDPEETRGHINGVSPDSAPVNGLALTARLPQASPLKPTALPNPDPAVPVDETSPRMSTQMLPETPVPTKPLANGHSSSEHPKWPPPNPPRRFKFRPILEEGYEAVFSLTLISGRYYPGISDHPVLEEDYRDSLSDFRQGKLEDSTNSHLWTLEGLTSGAILSMDPVVYKKDRTKMLEEAQADGKRDLDEHLKARAENSMKQEDEMDVDGVGPPLYHDHGRMDVDTEPLR
ncbi:hypothetical protein D9758_007792 [Tetrapyrgos nigripes]|uniref:Cryptic loci regulator 2 N-terminal domain-containing protein n=1 Tax=Tetrapyrgos nigripes TaxID=182062 RepID=A0A8H5FUI3_9AGAR|nr:hypothetical protein D9758_007792 [Tetrapyrgos nigripes]